MALLIILWYTALPNNPLTYTRLCQPIHLLIILWYTALPNNPLTYTWLCQPIHLLIILWYTTALPNNPLTLIIHGSANQSTYHIWLPTNPLIIYDCQPIHLSYMALPTNPLIIYDCHPIHLSYDCQPINTYSTLLNWPIVSLLILFILLSNLVLLCILVYDHTLCFTGSPCCSVNYYNYIYMTLLYSYSLIIHGSANPSTCLNNTWLCQPIHLLIHGSANQSTYLNMVLPSNPLTYHTWLCHPIHLHIIHSSANQST